MVKGLSLTVFLACMFFSGGSSAAPQLQVKVDKAASLLGEPVLVEINAIDMPASLSSMNLDKLKQDFDIFSINSNLQVQKSKGRARKIETMSLTLYPLRSGKLHLPALSFHGKQSRMVEIAIGESGKQTPQVVFKTAIDTAQPVVRQAFTLALEIVDDGSRQWAAPPELEATGLYQRRLAETQREENIAGIRYTVHRYAWSMMPLRDGKLKISFPMLDAFKFGARQRYPVAPVKLDATPVPAYLPVQVPIGKPDVIPEPLSTELALNRPINWTFSVSGSGISAEGLSKLLSTLHSNESMHIYPLEISVDMNNRATTATQLLRVTLPLVPLRTGKLTMPDINFPYYEPERGMMQSVLLPGATVEVFDPVWQRIRIIILVLLVFAGLVVAGYQGYIKFRHLRRKRQCLHAIKISRTANELSKGLIQFAGDVVLQPHFTLQQWLQNMQQKYAFDERLVELVTRLASAQYGVENTDVNVSHLANEIVQILHKLAPKQTGGYQADAHTLLRTLFLPPVKGVN